MALISILFILLLIFGTPIVFSLGIAASFTLVAYDIPLALVAQRIYGGLDKFTIMAIPFFILTGIIMEKGGIAKRIIDLATALVGWITGSLYLVGSSWYRFSSNFWLWFSRYSSYVIYDVT